MSARTAQRYIAHVLDELAPLREAEVLRALRLELLRAAVAAWALRALQGNDPAAVRELCRLLDREAALAGTGAPAVHRLQGDPERPLHVRTDVASAMFRALQQHPEAMVAVRQAIREAVEARRENGVNGHGP